MLFRSRQEYWSRLPFTISWDLPNPGIKPTSLVSPAMVGGFLTTGPPAKSDSVLYIYILFQILFHYRLLPDAKYNSLCYTVGPYSMDLSLKKKLLEYSCFTTLCWCLPYSKMNLG